jgi:GrpB-like predicted nucleotidyltransferase (UPF0157 family)
MSGDKKITIVEYNLEWPIKYTEEENRIKQKIGDLILSINHIGSTSVYDLGAKPIIDIMTGVDTSKTADKCQKRLEEIGYYDVTPQPENDEWFYCLGRGNKDLYYHLHLVVHNSDFHLRHIVFRDYLRDHPRIAEEYYHLKKKLAEAMGSDRGSYTSAKTRFIEETLQKAKEEVYSVSVNQSEK